MINEQTSSSQIFAKIENILAELVNPVIPFQPMIFESSVVSAKKKVLVDTFLENNQ